MTKQDTSSFNDLVDITQNNLKPIVKALRKLIFKIDPNACEVVRLGYKAASYGVAANKMSEAYCHILPHKSWVNLGFYQGAHLPDPDAILEGTGKNMRHVRIYALKELSNPAVSTLIKTAQLERMSARET